MREFVLAFIMASSFPCLAQAQETLPEFNVFYDLQQEQRLTEEELVAEFQWENVSPAFSNFLPGLVLSGLPENGSNQESNLLLTRFSVEEYELTESNNLINDTDLFSATLRISGFAIIVTSPPKGPTYKESFDVELTLELVDAGEPVRENVPEKKYDMFNPHYSNPTAGVSTARKPKIWQKAIFKVTAFAPIPN